MQVSKETESLKITLAVTARSIKVKLVLATPIVLTPFTTYIICIMLSLNTILLLFFSKNLVSYNAMAE